MRTVNDVLGRAAGKQLQIRGRRPGEPFCEDAETALIVGVGPGLGYALARKLSGGGMKVALASRNAEKLDPLAADLNGCGGSVNAYGCDATDERSVQALMPLIVRDLGIPNLVVYSLQEFPAGQVIDTEVAAFEEAWRANCLGAFIVGRESARLMVPRGRGTIVFCGATSGTIGRAGYANLAVGKFGLRALSQAMARELWTKGVHVTHLVIDAGITEEAVAARNAPRTMYPNDLAELIYFLHIQPRSAWTLELDARPWDEAFWEHC